MQLFPLQVRTDNSSALLAVAIDKLDILFNSPSSPELQPSSTTQGKLSLPLFLQITSHAYPVTSNPGGLDPQASTASPTLLNVVRMTL